MGGPRNLCYPLKKMDSGDNHHIYSQILQFKPRKADLRRMAILDAVIGCIAEKGLHALTAQEVGRRSKMRRSHVTYYFPNHDSMLEAAVKFVVSTGQEITVAHVATAKDPEGQLRAMVQATFAWFERYPKHASVMLLLNYYGSCNKAYRALNTQIRSAGENRMEAILKGAPARPGAPSPHELAVAMRAFLAGAMTNLFSSALPADYDRERRATEEALCSMARAYWETKSQN